MPPYYGDGTFHKTIEFLLSFVLHSLCRMSSKGEEAAKFLYLKVSFLLTFPLTLITITRIMVLTSRPQSYTSSPVSDLVGCGISSTLR